jgi:plastocyanin domain-containing protein
MSKTHSLLRAAVAALCLGATGLGITSAARAQSHEHAAVREIEIVVEGGYKPNRIEIKEGEHVRLKFIRKEYSACTREVVFAKLGIRRELPPNQPVVIDLPALSAGEYEFKCGMNMVRGTLVVSAHAR